MMDRRTISAIAVVAAALMPAPALAHANVPDAIMLPDGSPVVIEDAVVTYSADGVVYVASPESRCGIRVHAQGTGAAPGDVVQVSGTILTTPALERYVQASSITVTDTGEVRPVRMPTHLAGGGDLSYDPDTGAGQAGAAGMVGPNNIGMLVTCAGKAVSAGEGAGFFYLDDGAPAYDGNNLGPGSHTIRGLRVYVAGGADAPVPGAIVSATGVVSLALIGGAPRPVLLAGGAGSVQPQAFVFDMRYVPAGAFTMGNTGAGYDALWGLEREYPAHTVYVPAFFIGTTEVTRAQYSLFIQDGGYEDRRLWSSEGWAWKQSVGRTQPDWWQAEQVWGLTDSLTPPDICIQTPSSPVVGVTFYEAEAFCRWAGVRLPTEAEWEMAARGPGQPRVFPWGDTPDPERCNDWLDPLHTGWRTAPVLSFPSGASWCGCQDMAGNVWEWTADWLVSYPGSPYPFDATGALRSARGGGWYGMYGPRCASRLGLGPAVSRPDLGFRIAK